MSQAKYKVGQLMNLPNHDRPFPIAEVVTCYRFVKDIGAFWREDELTPYAPPLAVGDAVRATSGMKGVVVATHNGEYWVDRGERYGGCNTYQAKELERDPDAGKAVGT